MVRCLAIYVSNVLCGATAGISLGATVPNSAPFVSMAEASVAHFRRLLGLAWEKRQGPDGARRGKKRARVGGPSPKRVSKCTLSVFLKALPHARTERLFSLSLFQGLTVVK